ncbi:MAG: ABC transporter permease [Anaerolinea sp.]|nr:ABC transporter permease [Anaerolinea sp.]
MRSLVILIVIILIAPLAATHDPMSTDTSAQFLPPSQTHLLGTDLFGRDVWSRLAHGGIHTFAIASLASIIALIPGTIGGLVLSTAHRNINRLADIAINATLAFPSLITAFVVLTLVGQNPLALALAVGSVQIAPTIRVIRGAALQVRAEEFFEAARGLGSSSQHLLSAHVIPNIAHTAAAYTGIVFSYSLLNSAALSFLGLGGQPGVPDWGVMLAEGRQAFRIAPWIGLAPGIAITAAIMIVNHAGDQLGRRPRR